MLMNNLDPEVAERPEELVVYGGSGKAARNWPCYEAIVRTLRRLGSDETLLVQSGKPVAVFHTHLDAPRVLIANSLLVPHWATADEFRRLEGLGLTMYGQMTAGSWIYIGTQGILQGTFETLAECARQHFGGEPRRPADGDRRPRRHGRRPAAGGDHERRRLPGRRGRRRPHRAAAGRPATSTRWRRTSASGVARALAAAGEPRGGVDRRRGQRRRSPRATCSAPASSPTS